MCYAGQHCEAGQAEREEVGCNQTREDRRSLEDPVRRFQGRDQSHQGRGHSAIRGAVKVDWCGHLRILRKEVLRDSDFKAHPHLLSEEIEREEGYKESI